MNDITHRAIACPHSITDEKIFLYFDPKKPGNNALDQLNLRLAEVVGDPVAHKPIGYVTSYALSHVLAHGPIWMHAEPLSLANIPVYLAAPTPSTQAVGKRDTFFDVQAATFLPDGTVSLHAADAAPTPSAGSVLVAISDVQRGLLWKAHSHLLQAGLKDEAATLANTLLASLPSIERCAS